MDKDNDGTITEKEFIDAICDDNIPPSMSRYLSTAIIEMFVKE